MLDRGVNALSDYVRYHYPDYNKWNFRWAAAKTFYNSYQRGETFKPWKGFTKRYADFRDADIIKDSYRYAKQKIKNNESRHRTSKQYGTNGASYMAQTPYFKTKGHQTRKGIQKRTKTKRRRTRRTNHD